MYGKPDLKEKGLEFGRALHLLLRQCSIYSADHPSTQGPREQAFAILSEIFKSSDQLLLGFVQDRVLINEILTSDLSLRGLRQDLLQRGVTAVVLLANLTATAFKEFVASLAITSKALQARGGAKLYFQQNKVEGTRVVLAVDHDTQCDLILRGDGEQLLAENNWSVNLHSGGTLQSDPSGHRLNNLLGSAASSADADSISQHQLESMLKAALTGPNAAPGEFARIVSTFVENSGSEKGLAGANPAEIAVNLVEDLAANWAVDRLSAARSKPEMILAYEGVVDTLTRSLATAILLQKTLAKIAQLSQEKHLDPGIIELIRRDLAFSALPLQQQISELSSIKRYSASEFRQLVATIRALLQRGDFSAASKLAEHYVEVLALEDVTAEELSRVADLSQLFLNVPAADYFTILQRLLLEAFRNITERERHLRVVYLLGLLGRRALAAQDWDTLLPVVDALEIQLATSEAHEPCCGAEMVRLEQEAKLDDALETLITHRDSGIASRETIALCRAFGPRAAEKMTQRLEIEEDASTRMRLVRIIGQSGNSALRVIRPRLADQRWYVVRNASVLLGELGDPELLSELTPLLTHADERVQMSAVHTLLRKRIAGRELVLSESLPRMYAPVAEVVLDDLLMMRDPSCLPGLESFLLNGGEGKSGLLVKAVQVAAVIDSSKAGQLLKKTLMNPQLPISVHRAATLALQRRVVAQNIKTSRNS